MGNGIKVKIFKVGFCVHPGFVVRSDLGMGLRKFPATTALIVHPKHGNILFDTGYHDRFFQVTQRFPERFYPMVTPCTLEKDQSFREQLSKQGVDTITSVILSHFHADHIAGICDFPEADIVCQHSEYQMFSGQSRLQGTRNGYLKKLLSPELEKNFRFADQFDLDVGEILQLGVKQTGLFASDMFGDGSLFLVSLPGHTIGQMGMIVRLERRFIFFVADACWLIDNLQWQVDQHRIANFICYDSKTYSTTLHRLRSLYAAADDNVLFVPSHCSLTVDILMEKQWIS
jgi:glyoxylase-like metal-dependent hydrolase (beta-lactamase superfamily II)